jgi:hypothetical protein
MGLRLRGTEFASHELPKHFKAAASVLKDCMTDGSSGNGSRKKPTAAAKANQLGDSNDNQIISISRPKAWPLNVTTEMQIATRSRAAGHCIQCQAGNRSFCV